jgi:ubiquinone/menaquinone biosynthesis C-methylase UbiE
MGFTRLLLTFVSLAITAWPQAAKEANKDYQTPEARARIVECLESASRLANLRPAELVARLEIRPGSTVVDLGTGTGNLLKDLSLAVGPKGRVIAEDIHADFIERARKHAKSLGLKNVEFVLGTETDPKLTAGTSDLILVVDAYHHFDYPERMLAAIKSGLRPGGRLAIVEYHKKRGAMEVNPDFALTHIRAGAEQVVREIEAAGFTMLWRRDHAPDRQYVVVFQIR